MKIVIALLILACFVSAYFYYQGYRSAAMQPIALTDGVIPLCGSKPNCVCSLQDPSDKHYVDAIALNGKKMSEVLAAIESLGGQIIVSDSRNIQAVFSSGIFKFVDDFLVQIDGENLHVRSSSRVGHSDLGANRKRVEQLRRAIS